MNKTKSILCSILITVILVSACSTPAIANTADNTNRISVDEFDSSNGNSLGESDQDSNSNDPDYGIVFPQDDVNEITISISPENWDLMMNDMTALYGEQGSSQRVGPAGRPGQAANKGSDAWS